MTIQCFFTRIRSTTGSWPKSLWGVQISPSISSTITCSAPTSWPRSSRWRCCATFQHTIRSTRRALRSKIKYCWLVHLSKVYWRFLCPSAPGASHPLHSAHQHLSSEQANISRRTFLNRKSSKLSGSVTNSRLLYSLINHPNVSQYTSSGGTALITILKKSLSSLTYSSLCIRDNIRERGLESVPKYYYRDDGFALWDVIEK